MRRSKYAKPKGTITIDSFTLFHLWKIRIDCHTIIFCNRQYRSIRGAERQAKRIAKFLKIEVGK